MRDTPTIEYNCFLEGESNLIIDYFLDLSFGCIWLTKYEVIKANPIPGIMSTNQCIPKY